VGVASSIAALLGGWNTFPPRAFHHQDRDRTKKSNDAFMTRRCCGRDVAAGRRPLCVFAIVFEALF